MSDPAPARATRSSSRVKTATAAPAAPVKTAKPKSAAKPKSTATKPMSKPKKTAKKRAHEDTDSEEADKSTKKAKADDADVKNSKDEQDEVADDEPKKMVTVLKRGAAAVDPSSHLLNTHQVYADSVDVYDARLNQTEISGNKNKFYILQLLHPIGQPGSSQLFTRWGRVGEPGATQMKGPFAAATAVNEFKKQFKSKTGTDWASKKGAAVKKGKYVWLEPADDDEPEPSSKNDKSDEGKQEDEPIPASALAPELQSLCNLIFSTKIMNATLESMQYDANKLPLGKLAKSTILNGFAALKKIAEVIEKPNGDLAQSLGGHDSACQQLSNEYYSVIPHVFGRNRPTNICHIDLLKKQLDLVDALGDMDFAQSIISSTVLKDDNGRRLNPLDAHFRSLNLSSMEPVPHQSQEFSSLMAYARDTHGSTHQHYGAKILNAFRVERQNEQDAWSKAGYDSLADGEKLLLWHGSRTTNFAGILSQGLRIAPPEAPVTGYMFGKGVYFADMMSKSANYCYSHLSDSVGLLLLCEVAAKPFHEETNANYNADQTCKDNQKLCTKGIGRTQPVQWKDAGETLSNPALKGCYMPEGPGQVSHANASLQYNEYIVYNTAQIRVRYLLMVEMK